MMNVGYIEGTQDGVIVRVYYDATFEPVGDDQPLIDGPRGYCLDMSNPDGKLTRVQITMPGGGQETINVGKGDPVTGGPPAGRSRTAADLAGLGLTTRGDVAGFQIG